MSLQASAIGMFSAVFLLFSYACSAANTTPPADEGGFGGGNTTKSSTGPSLSGCDTMHCSDDFLQVLCDDNRVVKTCPQGQGCTGGQCVDACQAAKAAEGASGCEFYSVIPAPLYGKGRPACFATVIANTSNLPLTVQADYGGTPIDIGGSFRTIVGGPSNPVYLASPNGQLYPGEVGLLFLSSDPGAEGDIFVDCPSGLVPGVGVSPAIPTTGMGSAFHIKTDQPVTAYSIYPWGGGAATSSSATLLLPTSAWHTKYFADDAFPEDPTVTARSSYVGDFIDGPAYPFVQIVASEDDTHVTIAPTAAIVAGPGVDPAPQGKSHTYTLPKKGDLLQFLQPEELRGSPIQSDKPIGVWGGNACMQASIHAQWCDVAQQELPPVQALGSDYVAVRYRNREHDIDEIVPWTIMATTEDTVLSYDPAPPPGAPTSLNSGQSVIFYTKDAFSVRSDSKHPFYLAGHMTGAQAPDLVKDVGFGNFWGDPDYVVTISSQRWLPSYAFLDDSTYPFTHLVFIRQKEADGTFKDVTLDCIGPLDGWEPVGTGGRYEYVRLDMINPLEITGFDCERGPHTATSEVPFGLTVWQWNAFVSLGYPAGMTGNPSSVPLQ